MEILKQRILKDGYVNSKNLLKVDSFLNHQMDTNLYNEMAKEWKRLFCDAEITKILTVEASGIGLACITAQHFNVPALFAKKARSRNLDGETYVSTVDSYTHGKVYEIMVSKKYLDSSDKVLLIDDFLANGKALLGLIEIVEMAGATLVGAGIAIEKGFQRGGRDLRNAGVRIESLAVIESLENGKVVFAK